MSGWKNAAASAAKRSVPSLRAAAGNSLPLSSSTNSGSPIAPGPCTDVVDLLGTKLPEPGQVGVLRPVVLADGLNEGREVLAAFAHALHFANLRIGAQHRQFRLYRLDVRQQPGHAAGLVHVVCAGTLRPIDLLDVFCTANAVSPHSAGELAQRGTRALQLHPPSLDPLDGAPHGVFRVLSREVHDIIGVVEDLVDLEALADHAARQRRKRDQKLPIHCRLAVRTPFLHP